MIFFDLHLRFSKPISPEKTFKRSNKPDPSQKIKFTGTVLSGEIIKSIFYPIFLCHTLTSCGYNWGPGNRSLPGGHKNVFVEIFKNSTDEIGAEFSFTQALKRELEQSGFVNITPKDRADLIITGHIINVTSLDSGSQPTFFKVNYETRQAQPYRAPLFTIYKMQVRTNIKVIQADNKKVLWQTLVKGEKTYRGSQLTQQGIRSSNVLYNESRRKKTMKTIAKGMMEEAFDLLVENF